ncbi:MAG: transcriptional regulator [Myxococcales bacterium]|nr:transcriptional regulator [Myxococcales bacterium]
MPKMGIMIPNMGTKARRHVQEVKASPDRGSLADALFPRTKQRVLGLLFGQPERAFGMMELIELAGSGSGAVQRELERLVHSGLVLTSFVGTQKRYQANQAAPIFNELRSIVQKTGGVPQVLRSALEPLAARLRLAVLYGSVAKGADTALSDIDVLLVSDDLALEDVFAALQSAEDQLGRRINPTLYTTEEFKVRRSANHPFLCKVLNGEHVVLLGSEDANPATR